VPGQWAGGGGGGLIRAKTQDGANADSISLKYYGGGGTNADNGTKGTAGQGSVSVYPN
jgi:hypothetical protein